MISTTSRSLTFDFDGLTAAVSTNSPDLADAFTQRLQKLSGPISGGPRIAFSCRVTERPTALIPEPAGQSRPVFETPRGPVRYFADSDTLFLSWEDQARLLIQPTRGEARIAFRPNGEALWLASHPLFTLSLVELLKRHAVYSIHAAGVARAGRSLLISGTSGAGKSTLTLALLDHGLELVADDMTFLRPVPAGVLTLAFPEAIDLSLETIDLFPHLRERIYAAAKRGWKKLQMPSGIVGGGAVAWASRPAVLVFPTIAHSATSFLFAITKRDALLELTPNVILTDRASSQAHLNLLSDLVAQCSCYRLHVGSRLGMAARMLEALL